MNSPLPFAGALRAEIQRTPKLPPPGGAFACRRREGSLREGVCVWGGADLTFKSPRLGRGMGTWVLRKGEDKLKLWIGFPSSAPKDQ